LRDFLRSEYDDSHSRHGGSGSGGRHRRRDSDLAACVPLVSAHQYRDWGDVAGGLYLWHELRPVRDDEAENKRPLGLG
jgi:hypothetical protein